MIKCSGRTTIRRAVLLSCIILSSSITFVVRHHIVFERYLNSITISFSDFPSDYTQALHSAREAKRPIEYDDYSTFQSAGLQENIPPIIHFIWFANLYDAHLDVSKIPEKGSAAPDHCRSHNANFTVNVWNATDARALIETHYEWFLTTYDGYKHPIQRVDAFKYFVLFHYGGIYMDLDVDCRRPLDPLLPYAAWFPKTALLGVNNDVMAARAQHPLIREMTNRLRIRDRNLLFPYLTIYWSTGPQFTSDMVRDWVSSHRFRAGKPSAEEARSGELRV